MEQYNVFESFTFEPAEMRDLYKLNKYKIVLNVLIQNALRKKMK